MALAAWRIEPTGPRRLHAGLVEFEKNLESWIADDPSLIESGLLVIQRQMHVEGGFLDLLCVDLQGRPTVIELKRGRLIRETIAQGIDYASSIATMPTEDLKQKIATYLGTSFPDHPGLSALLDGVAGDAGREVAVVVGIGQKPGLDRMIEFLASRFDFPIRAVTFDVFDMGDGERVLVREEAEGDATESTATPSSSFSREGVLALAGGPNNPDGRRMLWIVEAGERHGLYARPYRWSFMLTPAQKKTRYLVTVFKIAHKDSLGLIYSGQAFAEFFPMQPGLINAILGPERISIETDEAAIDWVRRFDQLFGQISVADGSERDSEATSLEM